MKTSVIAAALFTVTAAGIFLLPGENTVGAVTTPSPSAPAILQPGNGLQARERPLVEVVFVLDTTGSMSGLIQAAKEKIWSIASSLAASKPAPEIRIGLVAYRDRGDAYVTRVVDLSDDLDSLFAELMDFKAGGGGDGPESVNQALHAAVHNISWAQDENAYRAIFLVGDAPPHMDYPNETQYPASVAAALRKGILVNTIQCGQNDRTRQTWQQIARLGQGDYFQVAQAGSAVAIATPFDRELAELSARLDNTRVYYGDEKQKAQQQLKLDATTKLHADSSIASRARRATYNASQSGKRNLLGDGELVEDVASGRVELSSIEPELLPAPMQTMEPKEQQALIEKKASDRLELQRQIKQLADQRSQYLKRKVEQSGDASESLDQKLFGAVRKQARDKGLDYAEDGLSY